MCCLPGSLPRRAPQPSHSGPTRPGPNSRRAALASKLCSCVVTFQLGRHFHVIESSNLVLHGLPADSRLLSQAFPPATGTGQSWFSIL